jgi:hypothetical protein
MVKEGFVVLPPVYFELSIAIETPLLVHEIDCAAGVPCTVYTICRLDPSITRALGGEMIIESTAVEKKMNYSIYMMQNFTEMKHI